jgi:hypothetical protein
MKKSDFAYFLTYSFNRIPMTYETHDYIQIAKCSVSWRMLEILEILLNSYKGSIDFLPKNDIIVLIKEFAFLLIVLHYGLFSIGS